MDFATLAGYAGGIVTIISICLNVIQYRKKAEDQRALRSQMQSQYNFHFLIARSCTRIRLVSEKEELNCEHAFHKIVNEVSNIRGVADTSRNAIIAYSREHLSFIPFYEHPAYPGKEAPDDVKFGIPLDELITKKDVP